MGEVMGPQMHQGGWTIKKGGGSRHFQDTLQPEIVYNILDVLCKI